MEDKKFTLDDAADLFGDDEIEEEIEIDPKPEVDPEPEPKFEMKPLDSRVEGDRESDDMIMDIKERALEMVGTCGSIYKLTLQGRLEIEFPLVDKRTIRKAVNFLKDHPEIKWPHNMLLQKR